MALEKKLVSFPRDCCGDVVVPSWVRIVGRHSFYRIGQLHSLSFEYDCQLEQIEDEAFKYCDIDELRIPKNLSVIGHNVTEHVKTIIIEDGSRRFTLGDSRHVTSVVDRSIILMHVPEGDSFHVPDYMTAISSQCFCQRQGHGFSVSCDPTELCEIREIPCNAFKESDLVSICVPVATELIDCSCFEGCMSLLSISFSRCCVLESLGDRCFMNSSLCQIVIPASVVSLSKECFCCCYHLEDVAFENGSSVYSIGPSCFEKCVSLHALSLPHGLKYIHNRAFHGTKIASLVFPSALVELGESCFPCSLSDINTLGCTGIHDIPNWSFSRCQLKSIGIPAKVLRIGVGSFDGCSCLVSVCFEDGSHLIVIGDKAFRGTGISAIAIPDSVQSIGAEAFCGTALCEISIPRCIKNIGNRAFANCVNLKDVRFCNDCEIRSIQGENVFEGTQECNIMLPQSVCELEGSFLPDGCHVSIPQENTCVSCDHQFIFNANRTKLIRCFRPTSCVVVPKHVQRIHKGCFQQLCRLNEIRFENDSQLSQICPGAFKGVRVSMLILPRKLRSIGSKSFSKCDIGLLGFEDGSQLTSIEMDYDTGTGLIEHLKLPENVSHASISCGVMNIQVDRSNTWFSSDDHFLLSRYKPRLLFMFDMNIVDVVVPRHVRTLCCRCFYGRRQVRSVTFESESELNTIEGYALKGTSISRFVVPRFVTKIKEGAFSGCHRLSELVFEDDSVLGSITCEMFRDTHLKYLYLPSNVHYLEPRSLLEIEDVEISPNNPCITKDSSIFVRAYKSLLGHVVDQHHFVFNHDVASIPDDEFSDSTWLETVSFSNCHSLRHIGCRAFSGSNLRSIHIPSSVEHIDIAFCADCCNLACVTFASGALFPSIGHYFFRNTQLQHILIPCCVRKIGEMAFYQSKLRRIEFASPCQVKKIGPKAFARTNLVRVTLPKSVECLGEKCFSIESLDVFTVEVGSQLRSIGEKCFAKSKLQELSLPPGVEVSCGCFSGVHHVSIHKRSYHHCSYRHLLLSLDFSKLSGLLVHVNDIEIPNGVRILGACSFKGCLSLRHVGFSGNHLLERIDDSAFAGSGVESMVIPRSVTSIGTECFSQCKRLVDFHFCMDSELSELGERCFEYSGVNVVDFRETRKLLSLNAFLFYSSDLSTVVISRNIEKIKGLCFYQARRLSEVIIEEGSNLHQLHDHVFAETGICSITLPASLEDPGYGTFQRCRNLSHVNIPCLGSQTKLEPHLFMFTALRSFCVPRSVRKIGTSCFRHCRELETVTFDEDSCLEVIGRSAFKKTNIREVILPQGIKQLERQCFKGCDNLLRFDFVDGAIIEMLTEDGVLRGANGCHVTIPSCVRDLKLEFLPKTCFVNVSPDNPFFTSDSDFILTADGRELLYYFRNQESIVIPSNVKTIQGNSFGQCSYLKEICFEPDSCLEMVCADAFLNCTIDVITLPRTVKALDKGFRDCMINYLGFEEGCELEVIGDLGCKVIQTLLIPKSLKRIDTSTLKRTQRMIAREPLDHYMLRAHFLLNRDESQLIFMFDMNIVDVVVPKHVRTLCSNCFVGRTQVKTVTFEAESKLDTIERCSLKGTSISCFVVPRLVDKIEPGAFSECPRLCKLVFEDDSVLGSITCGMFRDTHLKYLYLPSNVHYLEPMSLLEIEDVEISPNNPCITKDSSIFVRAYKSLLGHVVDQHHFVFNHDVASIPDDEFSDSTWLETVSFSNCHSLRHIGCRAFSGSNLRSIVIPSSVEDLGSECFKGCTKLNEIAFDESPRISMLPESLCSGCGLTTVVIPACVSEIGPSCFAYSSLISVIYPEDSCLKVIHSRAFFQTKLIVISIPKSVVSLGDFCFAELRSCRFGIHLKKDSQLECIGVHCFDKVVPTWLSIPVGVKYIGYQAFIDQRVSVDPNNSYFVYEYPFFISKDRSSICGMVGSAINPKFPEVVCIKESSLREARICSVLVPKTIRIIENDAFFECVELEEVTFESGSQIQVLGKRCFAKCKKLSRFVFDQSCFVKKLPEEFLKDTGIVSFTVPCSTRTIGVRCFSGCCSLTDVKFSDGNHLKQICDGAFEGSGLVEVVIPSGVCALGSDVFVDCSSLESVSFAPGSSIKFIGSKCFSTSRASLSSICLPDTLSLVNEYAFDKNFELQMQSDDPDIAAAFQEWNGVRDQGATFVNPKTGGNELIPEALVPYDDCFIGHGGQGVVKLKQSMITGEFVAVKTLRYPKVSNERWETIKENEERLRQLNHPCLVKVNGLCFLDECRAIRVFMEYISGPCQSCGSDDNRVAGTTQNVNLKQVLDSRPPWWTSSAIAIVILGVARGLDYIRDVGMIHRDLKPSNILLDAHRHPKICDFDCARIEGHVDDSASMTTCVGTVSYMAPEVVTGHYTSKIDLYSYGVILYEIFEGRDNLLKHLQHGYLSETVQFGSNTAPAMQEFIRDCLCNDPDCRGSLIDSSDDSSIFSVLLPIVLDSLASDVDTVTTYISQIESQEEIQ